MLGFFYISEINPILSWTSIKDHCSYFLEELEPSKTADYLFQYGVFTIDIHDEIEAERSRTKKTQLVLHYLEEEFSSCMPTFVHILKISNQDYILSEILKKENEPASTPQGKRLDKLCKSIVMSNLQTLCKVNQHYIDLKFCHFTPSV